jgi:hypothetical protein
MKGNILLYLPACMSVYPRLTPEILNHGVKRDVFCAVHVVSKESLYVCVPVWVSPVPLLGNDLVARPRLRKHVPAVRRKFLTRRFLCRPRRIKELLVYRNFSFHHFFFSLVIVLSSCWTSSSSEQHILYT